MLSVNPTSTLTQPATGAGADLGDVDVTQFLDLLIAELQNQDPLDPVDNSEMLAQINQIREISATDQLTQTLAAVLTGQNLTTASSLIGKEVRALTDEGDDVTGVVDRVSVAVDENDNGKRTMKVHLGSHAVELGNIREIVAAQGSNP